ncbi:MAG TPA: bifunctional diguanylate cyclase/phosphodiesterase [Sphingomicrobium sp.]
MLICSIGAFAIVQMFERARSTAGIQRVGWVFLTAVASGATIWCTHFVAMLAFRAGVPVTLDPALTIGSLAVAIGGTFVGISVAARGDRNLFGAVGGSIFGAAISAMHYMGMAAYRVDGIVTWNERFVATSIACSIAFGAAAFWTLRPDKKSRYRVAAATALIVLAIATLHFIAMTAMEIAPLTLSDTPLHPAEWRALALATALVGVMVIAGGVFAALIDRQTRRDAMRELAHMALNDALTGLPNRAGFNAEFGRRIEAARGSCGQIGLVLLNLNRFKEVNDVHGYETGDAVLALVGERLREIGSGHVVGRIGGDQFAALVEFTEDEQLTDFVDRIDAIFRSGLGEFRSGASIGVAVYPRDAGSSDALSNNAELALSRGRQASPLGPCYYDAELDQTVRDHRELAADLAGAIARGELDVHYQVQVSATTGEVTGYEALLRWTHPSRGAVPPSIFIPIAEENGLILELGEWVLRRACREAAGWNHAAKVAVNVSAVQLAGADLPWIIQRIMLDTGLPPCRLEIELTETAIMADKERALHVLRQVKALGVGVALDDFGTGYSSLETLRSFPFDKIKLDHVFTAELEGNPQSTAIVRAVLALGKSLSIPVLAEGVETQAQLEILLREGCDEIQGFLFGLPQAAAFEMPARRKDRASYCPPTMSNAA